MPNWKAPGKDGIQGYWINNLSNLHERIVAQTNKILMGDDTLPAWMTYDGTVPCQKDPRKCNSVENNRPITCLPLMRKVSTGVIAQEMYNYLEQDKLFPEEQKACKRGSRETKDQLLFDKTVLKDWKPLSVAWIGYKKAYDFASRSWVNE